jgi:hypothetical protein
MATLGAPSRTAVAATMTRPMLSRAIQEWSS